VISIKGQNQGLKEHGICFIICQELKKCLVSVLSLDWTVEILDFFVDGNQDNISSVQLDPCDTRKGHSIVGKEVAPGSSHPHRPSTSEPTAMLIHKPPNKRLTK